MKVLLRIKISAKAVYIRDNSKYTIHLIDDIL